MDKKKQIILFVAVILVIVITGLIIIITNQKQENVIEKIPTLELSQVIRIENIVESQYEIEQNKEIQVASKYIVTDKVYEVKANIEYIGTIGKMIYVREEYEKLNIYQVEYQLDKYEDTSSQIEEIMRKFEEMCKSYLNIMEQEEQPINEILYGEANQKEERPLEESIYYDNRLYCKTYEKEGKIYDINFYRNGEKINCELVYNIK